MSMKKIKKGDQVIVITGKDKGRTGQVSAIAKDGRIYVSGVNMVRKHQKPNPQKNQPGGVIDKESPLQVSNVAILNSTTQKADRVGIKVLQDGQKVRVYKSNDEVIDV